MELVDPSTDVDLLDTEMLKQISSVPINLQEILS